MDATLSVDLVVQNGEGVHPIPNSLMGGDSLAMKIAQPDPQPEVSAAAADPAESVEVTTPPPSGAADPAESVKVGESVGTTSGVLANASPLGGGAKSSFVSSSGNVYPTAKPTEASSEHVMAEIGSVNRDDVGKKETAKKLPKIDHVPSVLETVFDFLRGHYEIESIVHFGGKNPGAIIRQFPKTQVAFDEVRTYSVQAKAMHESTRFQDYFEAKSLIPFHIIAVGCLLQGKNPNHEPILKITDAFSEV